MKCVCKFCRENNQKEVYKDHKMRIVKCIECGLVFQCPVNLPEFDAYYSERITEIEEPPLFMKRRSKNISKIIKDYVSGGGRILDVGCGSGYMLKLLSKNHDDVHGIEPNQYQVDFLKKKGFNVKQGMYNKEIFKKDFFDAITFIQVMEHVNDPLKILNASAKHLKKDGILIIDVPSYNNPRILLYRFFGVKKFVKKDFILPHIYYYTPSTISKICEKSGFRVNKIEVGQYSTKLGLKNTVIGSIIDWVSKGLGIGSITVYAIKE